MSLDLKPQDKSPGGRGRAIEKRPSDESLSSLTPTSDSEADCAGDVVSKCTSYPDGGLKAWLVVLGSFCAFFCALSFLNSIGVYQSWISTHQLSSESEGRIGWIFGFYNFLSYAASLALGPLFDTYGARPLSLAGTVLLLTQYILLGFCQRYWHFFLCIGVIGGLGACALSTCAIGTVQHWFLHRRGLATGVAICGGSVSGIILPLIISKLLEEIGFRWTAITIGCLLLPFELAAIIFMETRVTSAPVCRWASLPNPRLLLQPQEGLIAMGLLLVEIGMFIPMTYITSYAVYYGMSQSSSCYLVTVMNVGSLIGRWAAGFIGDYVGWFNTQVVILGLGAFSIFAIWLPAEANTPVLWLFVIVFGVANGSGISLVPVCLSRLCSTENYGKVYGTVYAFSSIGYEEDLVAMTVLSYAKGYI